MCCCGRCVSLCLLINKDVASPRLASLRLTSPVCLELRLQVYHESLPFPSMNAMDAVKQVLAGECGG